MTSASPSPESGDHPEVVEIAALDEGLLPSERSREVQAHLAACLACADIHGSLAEVRDALGTLPGPTRMPDEIAGRIDAALAAETLLPDATEHGVSRETTEPPMPSAPDSTGATTEPNQATPEEPTAEEEPPRERAAPSVPAPRTELDDSQTPTSVVSRETPRRETGRPPGHAQGATGPGRSPGARRGRRLRWRTAVLGAAAVAVALGFGGFYLQSLDDDGAEGSTHRDVSQENAVTGDDLQQRVERLLGEAQQPKASQENAPLDAPEPSVSDSSTAGSLPSCVRDRVARSEQPLAFDRQTFRGQEVYLVVFPHSEDSHRVDAFLVDAGCVTRGPDHPGEIVDTGTYPRS